MTWIDFSIRMLVAFILGAGIGIERQWLKNRSVLKTNVLVSLGAAMFVMMAAMTPGDASPTRVAAQVVSGVGFLGAGVILREGGSVRGINTAATLWCAAAVGSLAGSGFLVQAYFGTLVVVGANLLLRPLVEALKKPADIDVSLDNQGEWQEAIDVSADSQLEDLTHDSAIGNGAGKIKETYYRCRLLCPTSAEASVLATLIKSVREKELSLVAIHSRNLDEFEANGGSDVEIEADFLSKDRHDELENLEQIVSQLKSKAKVDSVSWQFISRP